MLSVYNDQPIGVFDSGVGGLTVLRALQQQLPAESFLYLGDTARLPYGTKSEATVQRYARQCGEVLFQRGIKMLVVACNTASAFALAGLRQDFIEIPVIGVIEPGAAAACQASQTGRIAVIATEGTIRHGAYEQAILHLRPNAQVISQSCSLFVALAEEGWTTGPIAQAVARAYLQPLFSETAAAADCLVLGCTHFPALSAAIKSAVPSQVTVVDSAHTTALLVAKELAARQLLTPHQHQAGAINFLATDAPERFIRIARTFLGHSVPTQVELIDL